MDRTTASKLLREQLDSHGLGDWKIRINPDSTQNFIGLCMHSDKCIVINAHAVDQFPDPEITDTFLHEIAHALVGPGKGHGSEWTTKAKSIGVNNLSSCSTLGLSATIIDAIRSGAKVEVTFTEDTIKRTVTVEEKVYRPNYTITRLQDRCPECGKVAVEKFAFNAVDKEGNPYKLITLECFHIIRKDLPRATPFEKMVSNDWKPEVKNCKHDWNKNQCTKCKEYKLYNFQVIGAMFAEAALAASKGALIADDMGLGKTVQALAVMKYHQAKYKRTMVVTKSAIKFQWFKQAVRWLGPEFIGQVISTSKDYLFPNLKLYIIPYDLLRRFPREKLHALNIDLVILDEVQQIKNPDSSRTQEVRRLVSAHNDCKVIELSGTPWKNRGSEFFVALNLIDPVKFGNYQNFLDRWVDYYFQGDKKKMGGIRNIAKFKEYTKDIVIRREYNEVMEEFPEINRMKLPVQLDSLEQTAYDASVSEFVAWYNEAVIGGEEENLGGIEILAKMARMRHIAGLAKIPATLSFIEEFVEDTDRKLVIFVHHKDVGQLMYDALINTSKQSNKDWADLAETLKSEGISVMKYTSELSDSERFEMQEAFNKSKRAIMIASTLACGEGVDLQTCSDSILHERQWNPQNEDQATPGRFRRIGQLSNCINITLPEGEGTIDEHLDYLVATKRAFFHAAMNKGEVPVWNMDSFGRELAELIVKKHKEKNRGSGASPARVKQMASY